MEQIGFIISECMKSLICFTAVSYCAKNNNDTTTSGISETSGDGLIFNDETFLIPLSQVRSVVESHSVLNRPGGRCLLTEAQAKHSFKDWLVVKDVNNEFGVFLSY